MERDYFDDAFDTHRQSLGKTVSNRDWLSAWQKDIAALQQIKQSYHTRLQILVDETKPEHLPKKKAELQADLARKLAEHTAERLVGYDTHLGELSKRAQKSIVPRELKGWDEVRARRLLEKIEAMDPVMLRGEYESKIQDVSGRYDFWLEAAEHAETAMGEPMLPGEVLDRGAESRRLRAMDEKTRQDVNDLTELRDAHQHFVGLLARELPARDEIAEMAGRPESPDAA